jgi:AraC family transcriptional regulator of adaptative response/methylated-DNA-[protein]-cysteine methyltransferase
MSLKIALVNTILQSARLASEPPVLDANTAWEQVVRRDQTATFFYAVTTTGVFCRPTCSSRRPLRANVRFFGSSTEAQAAGFRPCKRCRPSSDASRHHHFDKIRTYIERNIDRQVTLDQLGRVAGLSPFTVQRLFKQAMGVSPLQYQRALRAGSLRKALKQGETVTNAIYDAGYGSASRAYEGALLGMTPTRFAQGGKGEKIWFTTARSKFGWLVVGATSRGLCWLSLGTTSEDAEKSLREEFPAAELRRDISLLQLVDQVLVSLAGTYNQATAPPVPLDLRGTAFQLRVWQALRQIPRGETRTYSQLAKQLGDPNATRAVARACATNRVALVVPCHRVVGASGDLAGYRWGVERKRQLLNAEQHS